jgi:hypothetical protein
MTFNHDHSPIWNDAVILRVSGVRYGCCPHLTLAFRIHFVKSWLIFHHPIRYLDMPNPQPRSVSRSDPLGLKLPPLALNCPLSLFEYLRRRPRQSPCRRRSSKTNHLFLSPGTLQSPLRPPQYPQRLRPRLLELPRRPNSL